jgi:hypothetical protein
MGSLSLLLQLIILIPIVLVLVLPNVITIAYDKLGLSSGTAFSC